MTYMYFETTVLLKRFGWWKLHVASELALSYWFLNNLTSCLEGFMNSRPAKVKCHFDLKGRMIIVVAIIIVCSVYTCSCDFLLMEGCDMLGVAFCCCLYAC